VGRAQRSALENSPGETWHEIFSYAAGAAAVTVSRPGADPPYRHELG
jgi:fructokinase